MQTVTIQVADREETPVADVVIRIFDLTGEVFVTQVTTNGSGVAIFDLPEDVYWVRLFCLGYRFDSMLTIDVAAGEVNTFDVTAHSLVSIVPSTVPQLCVVSGCVTRPDLVPHSNIRVSFLPIQRPQIHGTRLVVSSPLTVMSDEDGYINAELFRGGLYECCVAGQEDITSIVVVPDADSVEFVDLLWPYLRTIRFYDENDARITSLSLAVGESRSIRMVGTLSSGVEVPVRVNARDYILLTDFAALVWPAVSVVDVGMSADSTLTFIGVDSGTTTLSFTAVPEYEELRYPAAVNDWDTLNITVV